LPPVSGGAGTRTKRTSLRSARRQTPRKTSPNGRASRSTTKRRLSRPAKSSLARDFVVTDKKLSLDALIERVAHPGAGGITVFLGVVRDNARDRDVKFLEYEAYPELAEQVLVQIGDEAKQRWTDVRLAIAHRTGRLQIGEASVIIAASAPHRAEAFAACRYAIERLKVILPVWKKEFASDTEYWVEGPTPGEVPPERAEQSVREAEIV
ncbi:MAG TPA: molybdenum cofactor biosynthesis protein MoaE, partial [Anaerolineae bacterium]|nr:molybdenum cofactor biosynthesis protein MoaE [Anaerolineae bacterium]